MRGQPGFLDVEERLKLLNGLGDRRKAFGRAVDFEIFRLDLVKPLAYSNGSQGGHPPFDPVTAFEILAIQAATAAADIPAVAARNYRYGLTGDTLPWKPVAVYDDGRRVYVEFPRGIVQGEMPPIFVIGSEGKAQIVNSRIYRHILIVDRLFGIAEQPVAPPLGSIAYRSLSNTACIPEHGQAAARLSCISAAS